MASNREMHRALQRTSKKRTVEELLALHGDTMTDKPVGGLGRPVAWQVRHHGDDGFVSQWNMCHDEADRPERSGRFRCEYRPLYAAPAQPPAGYRVVPVEPTPGMLRDDADHDDFYEAALAFARAHVESDRIDAIDDADDPDISDARWTETCARYNETKAAMVRAFLSLSAPEARAEGTSGAGRNADHSEGEGDK